MNRCPSLNTDYVLGDSSTDPDGTTLVSKCLLGEPCQYDKTSAERQLTPALIQALRCKVVPVCPEELSGLPTPRSRMEICGGDGNAVLERRAVVKTIEGVDLTEQVLSGSNSTLELARKCGAIRMISRRRSPSCSCGEIYDGSFSGKRISGVGVTVALLRSRSKIEVRELEDVVVERLINAFRDILHFYKTGADWHASLAEGTKVLKTQVPLEEIPPWTDVIRDAFRQFLPTIHENLSDTATTLRSDSDTARFFRELIRNAWSIELFDSERRCHVCTYPEGFLDSYLLPDGQCSACKMYADNRVLFENRSHLQSILSERLQEVCGRFKHDAIVACSGGKDSTFMMLSLRRQYHLNLLCVMDDLNQQNDDAVQNVQRAAEKLGVAYQKLPPPPLEKQIRRNFLKCGSSFCRLCLRSHFARVYDIALKEHIPYIFFGLSPAQCLDCEDSISWSLNAIRDLEIPLAQRDHRAVLSRQKHRTLQGGFEVGFVTPEQRDMLQQWQRVFDAAPAGFAPVIVPYFLFEPYPERSTMMTTLQQEVGWKRPEVVLDRTNCRLLRLAGVIHRAIGRHHLNYKERATELRFLGQIIPRGDLQAVANQLECVDPKETMTWLEFTDLLKSEFDLGVDDLPVHVKAGLGDILV